jgi:hypothetical protein
MSLPSFPWLWRIAAWSMGLILAGLLDPGFIRWLDVVATKTSTLRVFHRERVGNRHRGTMLTKYSLAYELELVDNHTYIVDCLVAREIVAQLCRLIAIFSARLAMSVQPLSRSTLKTRITTRLNAAKAAGWAFHLALKRRSYQPYPKFLVSVQPWQSWC